MTPKQVNKWDVFALFAHLASDIAMDIAGALAVASSMLEAKAGFVDEQKSFHEYAARTIETLQQGD